MKFDDHIPDRSATEADADEAARLAAIGPLFGDRPLKQCPCGAETHGTYCAECRRLRGNAVSRAQKAKRRMEA